MPRQAGVPQLECSDRLALFVVTAIVFVAAVIVIAIMVVIVSTGSCRFPGQLDDVHPGAGTIGKVDQAAIVDFNVVGVDSADGVAGATRVGECAARTGRRPAFRAAARVVRRGDEIGERPRIVRIANVKHTQPADKP
jgi:hypothetical protein